MLVRMLGDYLAEGKEEEFFQTQQKKTRSLFLQGYEISGTK